MLNCLVEELKFALDVVSPTIGSDSSGHPGIRIKSHKTKDRVKLTSTDGVSATEIWIDAKVKSPVDIIVEGDRLIKYIAKLTRKEIKLVAKTNKMAVRWDDDKDQASFYTYDDGAFPEVDKINEESNFTLAGKTFKKLVSSVSFATKPDKKGSETPLLEGINLSSDGKRVTFTSMNGIVIAICKKTIDAAKFNLTAAKRPMVNAAKTARDESKVRIVIEKARVIVKHSDITYYMPVYAGDYPAFPSPGKDFQTSFTLEKQEMLGLLDRGATALEEGGTTKGILQVVKGKVTMEGHTQRNDFFESITAETDGKVKVDVKLDMKRMHEILRNIEADQVMIGIDPKKPVVIRGSGRADHTCVLAIG